MFPLDSRHKTASTMPIMSTATEQIRVRVPAARARQVRKILAGLGTDTGGLVNMLFAQAEMRKAIPFPIATTTGEGVTTAKTFTRIRRFAMGDGGGWIL